MKGAGRGARGSQRENWPAGSEGGKDVVAKMHWNSSGNPKLEVEEPSTGSKTTTVGRMMGQEWPGLS